MPTDRPCATCGMPTRSITRLCPEHRPPRKAKRPERRCSECGGRTTARDGVCQKCTDPERGSGETRPCTECGIAPTVAEVCGGCEAAMKDDHSTRPGESHYDLDEQGVWRFDPVRRVEVFVPVPPPLRLPTPELEVKRSEKRGPRVPDATTEEAERFFCDYCGANPGKGCTNGGKSYRPRSHRDRKFAAEAARLQEAVA